MNILIEATRDDISGKNYDSAHIHNKEILNAKFGKNRTV